MALWLGILTAVSPCPLATNVVAVSFIGRRVGSPRQVLFSGLFYALGRMVVYLALGLLITASLFAIPEVSYFLQKYMNKLLGPILILVGIFLLGLIRLNVGKSLVGEKWEQRAGKGGIWGAGLLGMVFALSFCPVSAALFFGSLIPLSIKHGASVLIPSLYGIGTALPVLMFAFLLAFATQSVGKVYNRLTQVEHWARKITGLLFVAAGLYYCLVYVFGA
ncbi:MAG: sulfite exporter TauE/SafE family protein [Ammonifex sp.]|nr:MAG: sulfite exporter TauE/SafE family protein [Ammonifex sp.]